MKYLFVVLGILILGISGFYLWHNIYPTTSLPLIGSSDGSLIYTSGDRCAHPLEMYEYSYNGGFDAGISYSIELRSDGKAVYTLRDVPVMAAGYNPPPINTKIPVKVFEPMKGAGVTLFTIYLDPATFPRETYDNVVSCVEKEKHAVDAAIGGVPHFSGVHIGALAYGDPTKLFKRLVELNTDSVFENMYKNDPSWDAGNIFDLRVEGNGVIYGTGRAYLGDVFNGLADDFSSNRDYAPYKDARNKAGEDIVTYIARIQKALHTSAY